MKFTVLNAVPETYLDQIMNLYKTASWTVDRKRDGVKSMLANSVSPSVFAKKQRENLWHLLVS